MNAALRRYVLLGLVLVVSVLYLCRFYYIQVVDDKYKLDARNQAFLYVTDYPPRGVMYDRNGKLLVYNQVAYDLMVVPRNMKDCDTTELCSILGITKEEVNKRLIHFCGSLEVARNDYRGYIFETQVPPELNARIQERLYKLNGFYVQSRTVRKYNSPVAAHLLGYVGEITQAEVDRDPYYRPGDYVGRSGIEKSYEEYLRGEKGVQIKLRDVHNNNKGSYENGKYDTASVNGTNLTLTLDADLQLYAEQLLQNKIGGLAAIDPNTGEILALVTSPTYDPNLLVGRDFGKNYMDLLNDTLGRPLYNRALQAMYPPGSTFKLMNALIGQEEGVLTSTTSYPCANGYPAGGGKPKCHTHGSPLAMEVAISQSCNSYFSYVFKSIVENKKYKTPAEGLDAWRGYVNSFGVGVKMETDLPYEQKGNVPTSTYYDKVYGKNSWQASNIISLGIGQGELLVTPLQMCNILCSIANRGFYYTPHIVRNIGDEKPLPKWSEKHLAKVGNKAYYENVIAGMSDAMTSGTARRSTIPGIEACGKTGTAQNPHGADHSVFVCFAPRENPKICVAVIVENVGQGAWWAAPIASLVTEKYLTGKVSRTALEKEMLEGDLVHRQNKEAR